MRRLVLAASVVLAACSSNTIPVDEQLMESGPGSPVEIRLVSADTGGVGMGMAHGQEFIKVKVEVSNISRQDIRVRRISVHQEVEGAIRVRPAIIGYDEMIAPGGEHEFELGLTAEPGDPSVRADTLDLRVAVFLESNEGYYASIPIRVPNLSNGR